MIDDESPFPSQAELNEEDARDLQRIVDWIHANGMAKEWMVGEQPVDYIIRLLERLANRDNLIISQERLVDALQWRDWNAIRAMLPVRRT